MSTNKSTRISIWAAKRLFDLFGATIGLLILMPVLPFIAIAIKTTSKGPVFYKQLRVGKSTPEKMVFFEIIKFRTMYEDAESRSGAVWATENDPRITPVGRFLRKTRLDEIPQLFNVIRGDMSLIGPRPERPSFYSKLENAIPYFADRTYGVMPGITGLAQVNQGYDTCIDDVRRKVGFDHSYALSLSSLKSWFLMDMTIISKTLLVMVDGRGQ
ncbi:sugar transferase [Vibrio mexicanus]|uniref:sugar transferase n=1 Tax=Vibrio mexicanus TaxID=1004326 RepID=UPI00063C12EF|nr:sugar transferase [Vibrio mexicanus]